MIPTIDTAPVLSLRPQEVERLVDDLHAYHALSSPLFQRRAQRQWSADSLRGLRLDMRRTSIAPLVLALHGADVKAMRALPQFVSAGVWADAPILQRHWRAVDETRGEEEGVLTLDGSDCLTPGKESVGVKRQDCGEGGTRATCQAGVCLGYASELGYPWVDRRLSLPKEWVEDADCAERRQTCGGPTDISCQTQPELGWEMMRPVVDDPHLRARWVRCDAACGRDTACLDHVAGSGLWDVAEVPQDTRGGLERPLTAVPAWSGRGRTPSRERLGDGQHEAEDVASLHARVPPTQWQRGLMKAGSQGPLVADFWAMRVGAVRDALPGPAVWLVLRRHIDPGALKTSVCHAPASTWLDTLARLRGMRWPMDTCCEDSKP